MDSSQDTADTATRYPILLVHGVGVRDDEEHRNWGRIPQALRDLGVQTYFGEHDGWGTPENNAVQLLERMPAILEESGATKVNIIAHSKGGLDARKMVEFFAEDEMPVASLTTLSTPHQGSRSLDVLFSSIGPLFRPVGFFVNMLFQGKGDKEPDFVAACERMTATHMQGVNEAQPALPEVYSQQFACRLQGGKRGFFAVALYSFVNRFDGPNDGLVTPESAAYDNYRGELTSSNGEGFSHTQLTDAAGKLSFDKRRAAQGAAGKPLQFEDILDFYAFLVADLKAQGC